MKNNQDNTATWVTIVIGTLMLIALVRSCGSKSDSHNGYHRSDPEMNRVSRD